MNDIYMKITKMASENVIFQIQNSALVFYLFIFHFQAKNKSNNCQISIIATCVSRTKVNLDLVNAYYNV